MPLSTDVERDVFLCSWDVGVLLLVSKGMIFRQ